METGDPIIAFLIRSFRLARLFRTLDEDYPSRLQFPRRVSEASRHDATSGNVTSYGVPFSRRPYRSRGRIATRRRGAKVPGHVANQRRSLCGTKRITVTRGLRLARCATRDDACSRCVHAYFARARAQVSVRTRAHTGAIARDTRFDRRVLPLLTFASPLR